MFRRAVPFAVGLFVAACSSSESAAPAPPACTSESCATPKTTCTDDERMDDGKCVPLGWRTCGTGFTLEPGAAGCTTSVDEKCAAGTVARAGGTCAKIASACADGFEAASSGWGCVPIVSTAPCTGATRESLGQSKCAPVGSCNATFPPANAAVFVDASYAPGALDATHKKTIAEAVAVAAPGAVIAVAAGSYAEVLTIDKDVKIVGRCPTQVVIAPAGTANAATLSVTGAGAKLELSSVTLANENVVVDAGASVKLSSVVVEAKTSRALLARGSGTSVEMSESVVRGGSVSAKDEGVIEVAGSASASLHDVAITGATGSALTARGAGSTLALDRVVVAHSQSTAAGDYGRGLVVRDGARATVTSSAMMDNHEAGVFVHGSTSKASLTDVTVERTRESAAGFGRGLEIPSGSVIAERVTVSESVDIGINVDEGTLTARELVVTGTVAASDDNAGFGIAVSGGGKAMLEKSASVANMAAGAVVIEAGSRLELVDSVIRETKSDATKERGYGISIESGGTVVVRGSSIDHNRTIGVFVRDAQSSAEIESSSVSFTLPGDNRTLGRGVMVQEGARATLKGCVAQSNREVGVVVHGAGSSIDVDSTVVSKTLPQLSDGKQGIGLESTNGGRATIRNVTLDENSTVGLLVGSSSAIDAVNTWITRTKRLSVLPTSGRGVNVQRAGRMTGKGLVVADNATVAVFVAADAQFSLEGGALDGTRDEGDGYGHALALVENSRARLSHVRVRHNAGAGVIADASGAVLETCAVRDNAIGIHTQGGTSIVDARSAPDDVPERSVIVTSDSVFESNATRFGSGPLPMPESL